MSPFVVAGVAALLLARLAYARLLDRAAARRRPLGPSGVIVGADSITLERDGAPAALLLHGAGDTPQVLAGLAEHLHAGGFAVRVPLLSAHGRSLADLGHASSASWRAEVRREFDDLSARHPETSVVGLSMGGALAIDLAANKPDLPALVLLAPYVAMPPGLRVLARTGPLWGWLLPYLPSLGRESIHDRDAAARTLGHGIVTPALLRALLEVMSAARRDLSRVVTPTLVVQSREDNRISAPSAEDAFSQIGASDKKLVWTHGAGHVITVDSGHEHVFALTLEWLQDHRQHERPVR